MNTLYSVQKMYDVDILITVRHAIRLKKYVRLASLTERVLHRERWYHIEQCGHEDRCEIQVCASYSRIALTGNPDSESKVVLAQVDGKLPAVGVVGLSLAISG